MTALSVSAVPLAEDELRHIDAYWRAANYLTAGQIYLMDNPLCARPLVPEDIKPRLLGHWGTSPGLNLMYAHLSRASGARELDASSWRARPRRPGRRRQHLARRDLQRALPPRSRDGEGMAQLFRQFSFPGGIPSHCSPETPGSIHEGGELGYALSHAFGAAFDNPDLVVACVDRRRGGRDGPAGDRVAHQTSSSTPSRRRRPPDPPPQRMEDRRAEGAGPNPTRELVALFNGYG